MCGIEMCLLHPYSVLAQTFALKQAEDPIWIKDASRVQGDILFGLGARLSTLLALRKVPSRSDGFLMCDDTDNTAQHNLSMDELVERGCTD